MKVKRESEVAQSCPTRSDPMDCTLPGSSIHGIFQARGLEWGTIRSLIGFVGVPFFLPNCGNWFFSLFYFRGQSNLRFVKSTDPYKEPAFDSTDTSVCVCVCVCARVCVCVCECV